MSNRRRDLLKAGAGLAASATLPMIWVKDAHAQWNSQPEKGAKLRVLRWSRFVQGDIDQYMKNVQAFTAKYGIEVRVDSESWEDVRPKAAVAANTGAGPDIILGTYDDANLYPEKLVDVTDLCNYLGKKYGGWYPTCELYLKPDGKRWIGVPLGATGSMMVYRESQVKAAGFQSFPKDTDGFLKMMKALKEKGTPGGFALGHATGDANTWCHWLVWTFGGKLVDEKNNVAINSPETLRALEYSKELYGTFIPGTLSWLDPNNNKAFLDGQISVTNNGISIYYASKNSKDPKINALQTDINHASYPAGPAGVSSACHLFMNQMIFKYTKYPKAAKEFIRFMMEEEQYGAWLQAGIGYTAGPL
ncbi:MAG: extracellular solute-binding protein, partial [Betaproteobacteria bacterium]